MAVVNTNISASIAQAALARNERDLATAMEQLSTGKKINSASDNAAGLAITNSTGVSYNPLLDRWQRSGDMGVNYMGMAEKPAQD